MECIFARPSLSIFEWCELHTIFDFQINDDNSEELEIMALELERKSLLAEYRDLSKKVDLTFQKS